MGASIGADMPNRRSERLAFLNVKYGACHHEVYDEEWFALHAGQLKRLLAILTTQDRVQSVVNSEGQRGANRLTLSHQEVQAPWQR